MATVMGTLITNFTKSPLQQTFTGKKSPLHQSHQIYRDAFQIDQLECLPFFRLFVDVKNGEPIPRKSILKSRSRENSVCSDTSESSAADFEERRMIGRSFSHDEAMHSDASDGITEEDSPTTVPLHTSNRFEIKEKVVIFLFLCYFFPRNTLSGVLVYVVL